MAELADTLRSLRHQRALSQRELASKVSMGRSRISAIESGNGGVRVSNLLELLDALDSDLVISERDPSTKRLDLDELLGLPHEDDVNDND